MLRNLLPHLKRCVCNPIVMIKTIKSADRVIKLVLAISVIIFYLIGSIAGGFALALFILACLVVVAFIAQIAVATFEWSTMD